MTAARTLAHWGALGPAQESIPHSFMLALVLKLNIQIRKRSWRGEFAPQVLPGWVGVHPGLDSVCLRRRCRTWAWWSSCRPGLGHSVPGFPWLWSSSTFLRSRLDCWGQAHGADWLPQPGWDLLADELQPPLKGKLSERPCLQPQVS